MKTPRARNFRRSVFGLLCGATLLFGGVAQAGEEPAATYGSVADLIKDLPNRRGAVIKLNPKKLTATEAKFYGCAFRDKKKWVPVSLTDDKGMSITVYQERQAKSPLELKKEKDHSANLMYAVLKAPGAKDKCKVAQFELIDY